MRTLDWVSVTPTELIEQHLEELRDYFLPGSAAYNTSDRTFHDRMPDLILHASRMSKALADGFTPSPAVVAIRRQRDAKAELEARRYSHECWQGRRTRGTPAGDQADRKRNLRRDDPLAWLAWHERMQHAQMRHRTRKEKVIAWDDATRTLAEMVAADLEPELIEGTGNQLAGVLERLEAAAPEGDLDSDLDAEIFCRSLFDMPRFDTRWCGTIHDPVSEMIVDEDEIRTFALRATTLALKLPNRQDNRNVRWNLLDELLDALSSLCDKAFVEALADKIFQRDSTYRDHIRRLDLAKRHRGRHGARRRISEERRARSVMAPRWWVLLHGIGEKSPKYWREVYGYGIFRRQGPLLWKRRHPAIWVGRGERLTPYRLETVTGGLTPFLHGPGASRYTTRAWKLRARKKRRRSLHSKIQEALRSVNRMMSKGMHARHE